MKHITFVQLIKINHKVNEEFLKHNIVKQTIKQTNNHIKKKEIIMKNESVKEKK